jgi:hypothetical protein
MSQEKIPSVGYSSYCSSRERKRLSFWYQRKGSSPLEIRWLTFLYKNFAFFCATTHCPKYTVEFSPFLIFCYYSRDSLRSKAVSEPTNR